MKVLAQPAAPPGGGSRKGLRAAPVDAKVLGIDRESDLALLKIDAEKLPVLPFGDSDKLRQGDLVLAIGSPLGLRNSVSMGVVSAAGRAVSDENPILYIQTDASINPGNSGGALVDQDGSLVGINSFIVTQSGGNEGIGFAIPSNVVRNVYQQLRQKGRVSRGSVRAFVQNITPAMAKGLGLPVQRGVVVADVEPDGPAARAGLKRKDIILSLNGNPVDTARRFDADINRRPGRRKDRTAGTKSRRAHTDRVGCGGAGRTMGSAGGHGFSRKRTSYRASGFSVSRSTSESSNCCPTCGGCMA